ncbi:MAG TPA: tetratricopeptide repeat protein [Flavihumibacter sp.]|nr:tetratricopeptide repeat protein [Bacteroidota bacterium]HQD09234.1 tetratricopeptide repeat protein [Flavihumibacter sp.]
MRRLVIGIICLVCGGMLQAQTNAVREGNQLYRAGKFDEAIKKYDEAIVANPDDLTASYNRANALAKKGDKTAAREAYTKLLETAGSAKENTGTRERALYDRGVLEQQDKQLEESIKSWKEALKLDGTDTLARENLQKALREKKKQDEQKQQQQPQKQPQQKDKKDQKQPPPPQSKLNQKQVEQLLKALEQKEKEVQKKLQQRSSGANKPDKDW